MLTPFERAVAIRYLQPRRQERVVSVFSGLAILGIGLGVAALIIVMSVMNGFRQELMSLILGFNSHITISSPAGAIADYEAVAAEVAAVPGVRSAVPVIEGQVMVTARGQAAGALVRGMRPEDLARRDLIAANLKAGGLEAFEGTDAVLIGTRMAQRMGLAVGDEISLISPQGQTTLIGTVPRIKSYEIVGLFEVGMSEYDSSFVFTPLEAAQLFFKLPEAASGIEVFVTDPNRVGEVAYRIVNRIGPNYRLLDWQRANSSFFGAIKVERNVMFIILTLITLVAAFNIISGQIMLVKNKGRDIAILRTMGATRGMIMRIFLACGASVGFIGTAFGFAIGLLFTSNIKTIQGWVEAILGTTVFDPTVYFLTRLPAIVDPNEVAAVVIMGLGLSVLATLYPSWRAARLDPVEALRYE